MKINIAIATAIVIGMLIQLAAIIALAVYAPIWLSVPLIVLMIAF
jgi:hypothetical protein